MLIGRWLLPGKLAHITCQQFLLLLSALF